MSALPRSSFSWKRLVLAGFAAATLATGFAAPVSAQPPPDRWHREEWRERDHYDWRWRHAHPYWVAPPVVVSPPPPVYYAPPPPPVYAPPVVVAPAPVVVGGYYGYGRPYYRGYYHGYRGYYGHPYYRH